MQEHIFTLYGTNAESEEVFIFRCYDFATWMMNLERAVSHAKSLGFDNFRQDIPLPIIEPTPLNINMEIIS